MHRSDVNWSQAPDPEEEWLCLCSVEGRELSQPEGYFPGSCWWFPYEEEKEKEADREVVWDLLSVSTVSDSDPMVPAEEAQESHT